MWATVTRVSASGMSRCIRFYSVNDGSIIDITKYIADVTDNTMTDKGLRIGGCGMDMIFSVLSYFNYTAAVMDEKRPFNELLKDEEFQKKHGNIYDAYFFNASYERM